MNFISSCSRKEAMDLIGYQVLSFICIGKGKCYFCSTIILVVEFDSGGHLMGRNKGIIGEKEKKETMQCFTK
jgi:hypothetical protein